MYSIIEKEKEVEEYKKELNKYIEYHNDIGIVLYKRKLGFFILLIDKGYKHKLIKTEELYAIVEKASFIAEDEPFKDYAKRIISNYDNYYHLQELKESTYYSLLNKGKCTICNKIVKITKDKKKYILPDGTEQTFYKTLEYLVGQDVFKAYHIKMQFPNGELRYLPTKERYRIQFYFRKMYKEPPLLDNANEIAAFIHAACELTTTDFDYKLSQTWSVCKEVTATEQEAASLFVYYGWAQLYDQEFPEKENMFYTVSINEDRSLHYEIISGTLENKFRCIEQRVNDTDNADVTHIITDKKIEYKDKVEKLKNKFMPSLFKSNYNNSTVRTGLQKEVLVLCKDRINTYIEQLLNRNAFDNLTVEEHIFEQKIDRSGLNEIIYAEPRTLDIYIDNIQFKDYEYNITSEYNKEYADELGAARSKKAAERNFEGITGDSWTTQELKEQGLTNNKITRLVENGIIRRVKRGHYERV